MAAFFKPEIIEIGDGYRVLNILDHDLPRAGEIQQKVVGYNEGAVVIIHPFSTQQQLSDKTQLVDAGQKFLISDNNTKILYRGTTTIMPAGTTATQACDKVKELAG